MDSLLSEVPLYLNAMEYFVTVDSHVMVTW